MNSLLLLVPISLVLLGVAFWAFAWAVRQGQFDDLETPALDILRERDPVGESSTQARSTTCASRSDDGTSNDTPPRCAAPAREETSAAAAGRVARTPDAG